MDKLSIQKNILDIEERNCRLYFTTQLVAGLTLFSIYATLLNIVSPESRYYPIFQLFGWISILLIITSFIHNDKADEKVEEIRHLLTVKKQ